MQTHSQTSRKVFIFWWLPVTKKVCQVFFAHLLCANQKLDFVQIYNMILTEKNWNVELILPSYVEKSNLDASSESGVTEL